MTMGTHPIPSRTHGKENFGPTTPSSLPRPPRPSPARSLTGSTRPPSTDGPKMAAAHPTPPAQASSYLWLGPACWARFPRPSPAALPAPPRPPLPRAGPGTPLTMAAELLVRPPACAAPRPEKEELVTFRHYVHVLPSSDSRVCRACRSTPDTQSKVRTELQARFQSLSKSLRPRRAHPELSGRLCLAQFPAKAGDSMPAEGSSVTRHPPLTDIA